MSYRIGIYDYREEFSPIYDTDKGHCDKCDEHDTLDHESGLCEVCTANLEDDPNFQIGRLQNQLKQNKESVLALIAKIENGMDPKAIIGYLKQLAA